jgi:hypothetical protein
VASQYWKKNILFLLLSASKLYNACQTNRLLVGMVRRVGLTLLGVERVKLRLDLLQEKYKNPKQKKNTGTFREAQGKRICHQDKI